MRCLLAGKHIPPDQKFHLTLSKCFVLAVLLCRPIYLALYHHRCISPSLFTFCSSRQRSSTSSPSHVLAFCFSPTTNSEHVSINIFVGAIMLVRTDTIVSVTRNDGVFALLLIIQQSRHMVDGLANFERLCLVIHHFKFQ